MWENKNRRGLAIDPRFQIKLNHKKLDGQDYYTRREENPESGDGWK